MTSLDIILIIVGLLVIILSATQGLIRVLIMFFAFYMVCLAAGMVTLAAEMVQRLGSTIAIAFNNDPPPLAMAQVIVFLCVFIPLFIAAYFLSKVAFGDTSLPEIKALDNILGAVTGIVLALFIMAVLCNTWGIAATAPRLHQTLFWIKMQNAYYGSVLRPTMLQILGIYQILQFVFRYLEYPPFFVPLW